MGNKYSNPIASFSGEPNLPQLIPDMKDIKTVGAGTFHGLFLTENGELLSRKIFNWDKMINRIWLKTQKVKSIKNLPFIENISCNKSSFVALSKDGEVYPQEQFKNPWNKTTKIEKIPGPVFKKVVLGANFLIGLTLEGTVYGYGNNYYGQLGPRDYQNKTKFPKITNCKNIQDIKCGGDLHWHWKKRKEPPSEVLRVT